MNSEGHETETLVNDLASILHALRENKQVDEEQLKYLVRTVYLRVRGGICIPLSSLHERALELLITAPAHESLDEFRFRAEGILDVCHRLAPPSLSLDGEEVPERASSGDGETTPASVQVDEESNLVFPSDDF